MRLAERFSGFQIGIEALLFQTLPELSERTDFDEATRRKFEPVVRTGVIAHSEDRLLSGERRKELPSLFPALILRIEFQLSQIPVVATRVAAPDMIRNMKATAETRKELLFVEFMAVLMIARRQSEQDMDVTLSSQHVIVIRFHSCPVAARLSYATRVVAFAVKVFKSLADFRQKFVLRAAVEGTNRDTEDEKFVVVKRCHCLKPVEARNHNSTDWIAI